MKWGAVFISATVLTSCGYHFQQNESPLQNVSISIPFIKGDSEGVLNTELIRALNASSVFDYRQEGGALILEVTVINDSNDRIGFRYDRDPNTGHLRDNIVGTENRRTITASVKIVNTHSDEIVMGPFIVKSSADYDYVDSNSARDLFFINPSGKNETVIDFSLGQLDAIEGASDDTSIVLYRGLAQKIVDGMLAHGW